MLEVKKEPRSFKESDIVDNRIWIERSDMISVLLDWQRLGYSETASGYGAKLTTSSMILLEGRRRRIYVTCYSNNGTSWINYKGKKIIVCGGW